MFVITSSRKGGEEVSLLTSLGWLLGSFTCCEGALEVAQRWAWMQAVRVRSLSLLSGNRRNIPRRQATFFAMTRQTGVHFAAVLSCREGNPINPISN